jgi:hypothetical protein
VRAPWGCARSPRRAAHASWPPHSNEAPRQMQRDGLPVATRPDPRSERVNTFGHQRLVRSHGARYVNRPMSAELERPARCLLNSVQTPGVPARLRTGPGCPKGRRRYELTRSPRRARPSATIGHGLLASGARRRARNRALPGQGRRAPITTTQARGFSRELDTDSAIELVSQRVFRADFGLSQVE